MYIHEYGDPADPILVLLAPMMVTGSELYGLVSFYLKGNYHIISPDHGGHGQSGRYVSVDEEYAELRGYLLRHGYMNIRLVFGASLGVTVGWKMFMDEAFDIEHVWFDGVPLTIKTSRMADFMVSHTLKKSKRQLDKTHVEASESLVKMYGYEMAKLMTRNHERLTLSDIDAISSACCHMDVRPLTDEQQRRLHLEYGEKDFDLKLSKKALATCLPDVKPVIREGYPHCGFMMTHLREYVEEMEGFITSIQ